MLLSLWKEFLVYLSNHWASLLTWGLVCLVLFCIKKYQEKWVLEKKRYLELQERLRIQSLQNNSITIKIEDIRNLKNQCDVLEELITAANEKLDPNNKAIDKDVAELMYQIGSHAQGRVRNVE